jgi:hypothetical protein
MKPMLVGIDQDNTVYRKLVHPRKDLLERLGRKHCQKIYIDHGDKAYHCGYLIAGRWISLYQTVEKEV